MAGLNNENEMPEFMVGSCLTMCPNAEIRLRQRESLVHCMEMSIGANGERLKYGNPRLMVKEFSRSAAGHEIKTSDIRPIPILTKTVKFLLTNSCCRTDVPWATVYQFVSDRLRAVRQDLTVQGVKSIECIKLQLSAIRFYIYAHYRSCEQNLADFDPYLNEKALKETLSLVLSLYQDLDKEASDNEPDFGQADFDIEEEWPRENREGDTSESKIMKDAESNEKTFKEEATTDKAEDTTVEFQKLSLRVNLDDKENSTDRNNPSPTYEKLLQQPASSSDNFVPEINERLCTYSLREEAEALNLLVNFGNNEALNHAFELPQSLRFSPLLSVVLKMNLAWLSHNYYRVVHLSSFLPPLFLCAFHPHIADIEKKSLAILSRSHSCKGQLFNGNDLKKVLFFNDDRSMANACTHYGIVIAENGINFDKASFQVEQPLRKINRLQWIDDELNRHKLSELLNP